MLDILKKVCKDGDLTAIYTNRNDYDSFSVGYILGVTEESFIIKHLSSRGEFDGYSVRKTDDVYRIETDGIYLKKIKLLSEQKRGNESLPSIDTNGEFLLNAIKYAIDNKFVATICIDESACDIVGYIKSMDNNHVRVLQITEYGENNGETVFPLQEILKLCINDLECMDLDILYRNAVRDNTLTPTECSPFST